jgi:uncharacterized protein (TIGR02452 family)
MEHIFSEIIKTEIIHTDSKNIDDLYLHNVLRDTINNIINLTFYNETSTINHVINKTCYDAKYIDQYNKYETLIEIVNEDTLTILSYTINKYKQFDKQICILNLGNAYGAGGGAIYGQRAQEEDLCRRTTLLPLLFKYKYIDICGLNKTQIYDLANRGKLFSYNSTNKYIKTGSVLYTENVIVFKDAKYNIINRQLTNVITACAVRYAATQRYTDNDKKIMLITIMSILDVAYKNKQQILILGALGCGAFNNDPRECALIFKECIQKYNGYFYKIIFAILSKNNNANYQIFRDVFIK